MKIGFTGTQKGMTALQHRALESLIPKLKATEFHHGCCNGADCEAFDLFHEHAPGAKKVAHPPTDMSKACQFAIDLSDEVREAKPYLVRDEELVAETARLVAAPKSNEEMIRSGTWATVRMARRAGKPIVIVWPSGMITYEEGK